MKADLKIVKDGNNIINIKKTCIAILDYYQNKNTNNESDFVFTIDRISRSDYDIIRSDILHNYELLFTIEDNQFYNISNPIMEVHIYSPTY